VVVTSFTFVPARWFPERERALATTLAVQANYAGWATGTLIPSVLSDPPTKPSLEHVLLWQAILISATTTPLYVLANSRSPKVGLADPEAYSGELPAVGGRKALGVLDSARLMLGRPQFLVHALCYAVLGGVGFGVSGVVDEVFSSSLPRVPALACNGTQVSDPCDDGSCCTGGTLSNITVADGFSPDQTMWINFSFVATGVVTGLVLGALVKGRGAYPFVLRGLFLLSAASLLAVQLLLYLSASGKVGKQAVYGIVLLLMALSGAGSLGFIGIGLRVAVEVSHPVDDIYAGGAVEFFLNAFGTALGELTSLNAHFGFWWFAGPACLVAFTLCFIARFTPPEPSFIEASGASALLDG